MGNDKQISLAVIKRLPRYYRYLQELLENGVSRISSMELSVRMNITASQIRQDLNNFGCFGQQGYGYNVELLFTEIGKILGVGGNYQLIVIGAGNIGQALAKYDNFIKRGYHIIAIFDKNPSVIGKPVNNLAVRDVETLEEYMAARDVDIAVMALPSKAVAEMARRVIALGVKGIWNFSAVDLEAPTDVYIENVHLTDSLMTLSYKLSNDRLSKDKA